MNISFKGTKMIKNKFCIVVAVYNAQTYIEACLLSIKKQRYTNWECIIIDDSSTDFTPRLIEDIVKDDLRFKLIKNTERKFCLYNRIIGNNNLCTNDEDIVIDIDGDDKLVDNDVLNYLNQVYQNPDVWITYGQFRFPGQENSFHCRKEDIPFYRLDYEKHNISHLRTYKYWLFKKIKEDDLKLANGTYPSCVGDMFTMFPMCEMAGSHLKFIPKVLYEYNNTSPYNIQNIRPEDRETNSRELFQKSAYPLLEDKNKEFTKISIKLFDKNFSHCKFTNGGFDEPKYIEWYKGNEPRYFNFFTDKCLAEVCHQQSGTFNVAWLLEPKEVSPQYYEWIKKNYHLFDYVLSYDKEILDSLPNAFFIADGVSWMWRKDWKIYPKTKQVILMASLKKDCAGHKLRYKILERYGQFLTTVSGTETTQFSDRNRIEIIKDYRYLIEIQNCKLDYYFTQRLIDAFLVGSIPIYWGCPSISKFFNPKGIITFNSITEVKDILLKLSKEDYQSRLPAIQENFILAHRYVSMEDYIYLHFIRQLQTRSPLSCI